MKIVDNFLSETYFNSLQSYISSSTTQPWYYNDNISINKKTNDLGGFGFSYTILKCKGEYLESYYDKYIESGSYTLRTLKRFLFEMRAVTGCDKILRSRMDMTVYSGKSKILEPHTDYKYPHTACIFYVNDSDGNTVIYDQVYNDKDGCNQELTIKEEIEPKANRLVVFDGMHIHTGHTPSKHNNRVLINSNFV